MVEFVARAPARPDAILQKRGIARVGAILDAAESILGEQGYEAATLKAIAERAAIPIASVYHYFADRHQVDIAILQRHLAALDAAVKQELDDRSIGSVDDAVNAVIDSMISYFRQEPSCIELWYSHQRDSALISLVEAYDAETADLVWKLALERGFLAEDTPRLVMQLAFEAGGHLFDVAFRRSPRGDDVTIDEARRMIAAYLKTYRP